MKQSAQASKSPVAVVVPLYNRKDLTPDEQISFRHLVHHLGKYDKWMVAAQSLDVDYPGFGMKRFADTFFGSKLAYSRLMLTPQFYEAFKEYKYILLYQLDALVFSDQLLEWCETDLDYIGAPWLPCEDAPHIAVQRVGNGGFSLRKVESFLKVIDSSRHWIQPYLNLKNFCSRNAKYSDVVALSKQYLKRFKFMRDVRHMFRWRLSPEWENEDCFWSDEAIKYFPEFRVASVETGLRFAFEVEPKLCYKLNNYRLPLAAMRGRATIGSLGTLFA